GKGGERRAGAHWRVQRPGAGDDQEGDFRDHGPASERSHEALAGHLPEPALCAGRRAGGTEGGGGEEKAGVEEQVSFEFRAVKAGVSSRFPLASSPACSGECEGWRRANAGIPKKPTTKQRR